MYSAIIEGKVLDYNYKKHFDNYLFYIGDHFVGQIRKHKKNNWVVITCENAPCNNICPQYGFTNRYYASEFLLKFGGYIIKTANGSQYSTWEKIKEFKDNSRPSYNPWLTI